MSDSPMAGGRAGAVESPVTLSRTRSGSNTVRPQPVTEQSLMESVAGQFFFVFFYIFSLQVSEEQSETEMNCSLDVGAIEEN